MEKTDEYLVKRLMFRAGKYGLPTQYAFYFKDLAPGFQQSLNSHIDVNSGTPILLFTKPSKEWTLLCTRQVIFNNDGNTLKININNIRRIGPTSIENIGGQLRYIKDFYPKREWDKIFVTDKQDNVFTLYAEGSSLFAMWGILLTAVRLNS